MADYTSSVTMDASTQRVPEPKQLDYKYCQYNSQCIDEDIDPERNFFASSINDCQYYSEDRYNSKFRTDNNFSIIHFNSRSLYANFHHIKDYLKTFKKPFNVILISETWINENKHLEFGMEGYDFIYINRRNKQGGGVAMFIDITVAIK